MKVLVGLAAFTVAIVLLVEPGRRRRFRVADLWADETDPRDLNPPPGR